MTSNLIALENSQREAVVSLDVSETQILGHLVQWRQLRADPIRQPHDSTMKYGGQFEEQQSVSGPIGVVVTIMQVVLNFAANSNRVSRRVLINHGRHIVEKEVAMMVDAVLPGS